MRNSDFWEFSLDVLKKKWIVVENRIFKEKIGLIGEIFFV
jgi:hypothetical protein